MKHPLTPRGAPARRGDDGFSVVEVTVAIAVITIVMTALAGFFVNSARSTDAQGQRQAAIRVATDAVELVRSLTSIGITTGRDQQSSAALWADGANAAKFPGVAAYQTGVTMAYDDTNNPARNAGYGAALPTNGKTTTLDGITFTQNWFIGTCLRDASGNCSPSSGVVKYFRVIVAVTWSNPGCPNSLCSYVTSTLVSPTQDPEFDASKTAPKPRVVNPGNLTHETGQTVSIPVSVNGGTPAFTWTPPTTLPAGLRWGNTSADCPSTPVCIVGVPTAVTPAGNPARVTLTVVDSFGYKSSASFDWTITLGPTIAFVADRTSRTGTADTLNLSLSGGKSTYDWSKTTGLPPGMTISGTTSTPKISGTPTTGGTYNVRIKVVDSLGAVDTEDIVWTVQIGSSATTGSTTGPVSSQYTCTWDVDVYGTGPFSWTTEDSRVTITTSNGTLHAKYTVKLAKGTYTFDFGATQNSSGAGVTGSTTCYAGTK